MSIDLHIHSTYSDGTMSPKELVVLAKLKGLEAIAITDHDTVDGLGEAVLAGNEHGLEVISGVELGAAYSGTTIHILAYLFDHDNSVLRKSLETVQHARKVRNEKILKRLRKYDIHISSAELHAISPVGQTGRPHIARMLVKKGIVKSLDEAFSRFLRQGEKAYVPRFVYPVKELFAIIHQAGGICVIAHPLQLRKSGVDLPLAIKDLVAQGADGIEVYYPTHSKKIRKILLGYAKEYDLIMTGGSDYHGETRPGTTLAGGKNVCVPAQLLTDMKYRFSL